MKSRSANAVGYRRNIILLLILLLSGCATHTSPYSYDFAAHLKENIYRRVHDENDLYRINPAPPKLLIMIFYYDSGVLKDAQVVQSSGNPSADAETIKLVLSADVPNASQDYAGKRIRFTVQFCFLHNTYECDYLTTHTNVRKVLQDYDRLHEETSGVIDPSDMQ